MHTGIKGEESRRVENAAGAAGPTPLTPFGGAGQIQQ